VTEKNKNPEEEWMSEHLFNFHFEEEEEWTISNNWGPEYKSQLGQDRFVETVLSHHRNGYFIDIGAAHPVVINNTHFLEKKLSWEGLSIDLGPEQDGFSGTIGGKEEYYKMWKKYRSTPLICDDALKIDYSKLFKERGVPKVVDYLTLDLEPAEVTFECLLRLPFDEYEFRTITFEHDFYRNPDENIKIVETAREFLSKYGYATVNFASLRNPWPLAGFNINKIVVQEDWFINQKHIEYNNF
jgi:hypothetical protein